MKLICERCGKEMTKDEAHIGPDPYASEVWDDPTEVTQCKDCAKESADEVHQIEKGLNHGSC